jgi:hypothetical protein
MTCNEDCIVLNADSATKVSDCYVFCDNCFNNLGCWEDIAYGSAADFGCYAACYDLCAGNMGEDSSMCN